MIRIDSGLIRNAIKPRPTNAHKGTFGHALIIAGSEDKMGAAILSSSAALRCGCGLLSVYITPKATTALLSHLPEAMILPRKKNIKAYPDYAGYKAIGIGPGMGLSTSSE